MLKCSNFVHLTCDTTRHVYLECLFVCLFTPGTSPSTKPYGLYPTTMATNEQKRRLSETSGSASKRSKDETGMQPGANAEVRELCLSMCTLN